MVLAGNKTLTDEEDQPKKRLPENYLATCSGGFCARLQSSPSWSMRTLLGSEVRTKLVDFVAIRAVLLKACQRRIDRAVWFGAPSFARSSV